MEREAAGSVAEMKDAAETEGARRATGVSADGGGGSPDPEVEAKAKRRRFSAEYRLRILRQADALQGARASWGRCCGARGCTRRCCRPGVGSESTGPWSRCGRASAAPSRRLWIHG